MDISVVVVAEEINEDEGYVLVMLLVCVIPAYAVVVLVVASVDADRFVDGRWRVEREAAFVDALFLVGGERTN